MDVLMLSNRFHHLTRIRFNSPCAQRAASH